MNISGPNFHKKLPNLWIFKNTLTLEFLKIFKYIFLRGICYFIVLCTVLHNSLFVFWDHNSVFAQLQSNNTSVYLPLVLKDYSNSFFTEDKFIGIYMPVYWQNKEIVNYNLGKANQLAGKTHSVVGWFIGLQDKAFLRSDLADWEFSVNNFYRQLEALWNEGYISFVNIGSGNVAEYSSNENCPYKATLSTIANGSCDKAIRVMAKIYKKWVSLGNGRKAFFALFPEMNDTTNIDNYTSGDIESFKKGFQRIRQIFVEENIENRVWWVFAPNGWSEPGHEFEKYYPGDDLVDIVAFSSYNFGYCWVMEEWGQWADYEMVFKRYLTRFQEMAPSKPIIIAQTGVVPDYSYTNEKNYYKKNEWIRDNYIKLSMEPPILGVLYFDIDGNCNWGITSQQDYRYTGYADGTLNYKKLTSFEIDRIIK